MWSKQNSHTVLGEVQIHSSVLEDHLALSKLNICETYHSAVILLGILSKVNECLCLSKDIYKNVHISFQNSQKLGTTPNDHQ